MKIFYSAEIGYSNFDDPYTTIEIYEWRIYKETKKGYWVATFPEYANDVNYKKYCKWIPNREKTLYGSRKIKTTKEIAVNSLYKRLKKRISWYKYWMEQCENGLKIIEENKGKIPECKPYTMKLD